jgi:acetylornithine deacetylase/succinyl-diaminopimelate desuccinylase-like protein
MLRRGHPGGARLLRLAVPTAIVLGAVLALGAAGRTKNAPGAAKPPLTDDEIVGLLRDYLRIDTSNPPGNELRGARFFKDWFDREGISAEIFEFAPGRANLVARLKGSGGGRPLLLLNHMDVVNAERPYWSVDPFGGVVKDGFIYGRGALDMKTTGLIEAAAMVNLARSGGRPARDIIFAATADEEVGAQGAEWIVRERPDLVKDAEFMINEGGVIDEVGGVARSYDVGVTEKVPMWIKITARGRPGHGSQPFVKDNAVLALLRALDRLARYETPLVLTPAAEGYFRARAELQPPERAEQYRNMTVSLQDPEFRRSIEGDPFLNAIIRNTISITMLQGAPQTNIIPTVAESRVDIRLLPGQNPQAFLDEIRRVIDTPGVSVEPVGVSVPATASPVDSELMRAIDRARARHHPDTVLAPVILTGWTESALMRTLGIKAYGFEPYVLEESEQNRAHGNDERISVKNVLQGARIMEEVVRDICRCPVSVATRR